MIFRSSATWLIKIVLVLLVLTNSSTLYSQEKSATDNATSAEEPAPYVLRILNSGESKPRSSNDTEAGRQDNRRTDVTLTRKVPVAEVPQDVRKAIFGSGGTLWLSTVPGSLDRILHVDTAPTVALSGNTIEAPIEFKAQTNYANFIDKWEVRVFSAEYGSSSEPLFVKSLGDVQPFQSVAISDELKDYALDVGAELQYQVRAYDKQGRIDQSKLQSVRFVKTDESKPKLALPEINITPEIDAEDSAPFVELDRMGISLSGGKVRLHGQALDNAKLVSINGVNIPSVKDGRFTLEYILPQGKHKFVAEILGSDSNIYSEQLSIDIDDSYFFMVGLADLTVGENKVSGSMEALAVDQHHYGGDIFVDGRLAFYLKGKIKGKYLLTAQMDTGTENISNLFDNFHRKDPQSVFRRLDPDQYYPVYGDQSKLTDDTDSQGKLYVRVEWDRSRFIWGNFNTNFTGTEYVPFNRSLYGAQLLHISPLDTSLGDATHTVNAFASKAQSLFRHNEFLGTGGSLYYLRDSDIVAGSEKVWVEIRQSNSERVLEKIPLVDGRDYDIDNFQGRLILHRPLISVSAQGSPSIIRDEPLAGNQAYLIVDYEFSPQNLNFGDSALGIRAKKWINDHVAVGASWAHENRTGDDYDIKGTDLTLKRSENTFIKLEFAQSESAQTGGSFISTDGGLNFEPFNSNTQSASGNALGMEARASLKDFRDKSMPVEVGAWAKKKQAGFSTANTDIGYHTTEMGFEIAAKPKDNISVFTKASRLAKQDLSTDTNASAQIEYQHTDRVAVSGEVNNRLEENIQAGTDGKSTLVAGKVSIDATDRLNVYGIQQVTVNHSGTQLPNDATSVGAKYNATDKYTLSGELSTGDRGNSALLGTEVNISDTYSVYSNYTYSFNRQQTKKNSFIVGQRKSLSNQLKVFTEHQFTDDDDRSGFAHTVGFNRQLTDFASLSLSIQRSSLEDNTAAITERTTVSAGYAYQQDKVSFSSKLEYRVDNGDDVDQTQWVTTNRFEYRKTPSFTWQGKFNASFTEDLIGNEDARFVEAGVGFAYRPVQHDRFNLLARLTYLNDLKPLSQSDDADERSLIASAEGLYDITRRWSIGSKLAHRSSELRLARNTGIWIGNDASLAALRLRYKAPFKLDVTAAYHWLLSEQTQSTKHGALFSIGHRVGNNLTFAVGYNLTDFDDDLSSDSYDVKGWFINLIGTY